MRHTGIVRHRCATLDSNQFQRITQSMRANLLLCAWHHATTTVCFRFAVASSALVFVVAKSVFKVEHDNPWEIIKEGAMPSVSLFLVSAADAAICDENSLHVPTLLSPPKPNSHFAILIHQAAWIVTTEIVDPMQARYWKEGCHGE